MYGTYLTLAVVALLAYILWRAAAVPRLSGVPGFVFPLAGSFLALLVVAGRQLGQDGSGPAATILEFSSWTLAGSVFLVFVCLFPMDLFTGFGLFFRRRRPRLLGWAILAGLLLSSFSLFQGLRPPAISRHEAFLPGLPRNLDGTRVAAISDLHLGTLIGPRWLRARAEQLRSLEPDLILFLGDTFEGHGGDPRACFPVMRGLRAPLGVWAVDGNHEMYGRRHNPAPPADYPLRVLRDETVEPAPGLFLAGRSYRRRRGEERGAPAWNPEKNRRSGGLILMAHVPEAAEAAARAGVGLMLSGHTHGGQIWPMSYATRAANSFLAGAYRVGDMTLLVSRGAGTWGPRMRLWRPGEIVLVTLRSRRNAP
jgi:predicted MPP superfamily phosphohydrolase